MRITVFTPTYNRVYIIEKLYRSLQRQTFRDFEWLVVDDGSSDNTEAVIAVWQQEGNDFPIRYYKKENGGKCRAINYGVDRAEGELFFNVDSDDYLTDDALEKVSHWVDSLPEDGKFCGVVGNLGTSPTETPNTPMTVPYRDATLLERYADFAEHPIDGERAPVFFTEIQKEYKYPEFEGEKFVTPAVTWNRMAHDGYRVRVFDDIIWIYEYQPDGLTANAGKNFIRNPRGAGLWQREKSVFIGDPLTKKMKMWFTFYCDHTFCDEQYRLTMAQCAAYIGAPLPFIWLSAAARSVLHLMKKVLGKS